jgi:hypothetical protein
VLSNNVILLFLLFAGGAGADGCGQNISNILLRPYSYSSSVVERMSGLRSAGVYCERHG